MVIRPLAIWLGGALCLSTVACRRPQLTPDEKIARAVTDMWGPDANRTSEEGARLIKEVELEGAAGKAALFRGLDSPSDHVRAVSASALGDIHCFAAVPALTKLISAASLYTATSAIHALGMIGSPEALTSLEGILKALTAPNKHFEASEDPMSDTGRNRVLASTTIRAVGHIGNRSAVPLLTPLLGREGVQYATADALGVLGGPDALDALEKRYAVEIARKAPQNTTAIQREYSEIQTLQHAIELAAKGVPNDSKAKDIKPMSWQEFAARRSPRGS